MLFFILSTYLYLPINLTSFYKNGGCLLLAICRNHLLIDKVTGINIEQQRYA